MQPRTQEQQANTAGSCPASCPLGPPSPSLQGCSQGVLYPVCINTWDCPGPSATPCTWPCWTSLDSHGPSSPACPGPSAWLPFPTVYWLHHSACCHLQTCWGYTWFPCLCYGRHWRAHVPRPIPEEHFLWLASTGTSDCHDFSNIMEGSLATTSAIFSQIYH